MCSCRTGWLARLVAEFEKHPDVKLLAPLNYHQTLSHPFGADNSTAAWFKTKKEQPRPAPLRQFHVYSGGLSIDEFDELMCSTHAGEPGGVGLPARCSSAPVAPCWTPTSSPPRAGWPIRGLHGYGSEDVDLCWRIGEQGGQIARTTAVYVHHFHNSSLIDNAVDPEAALRRPIRSSTPSGNRN